jgi:hypothetical protein
MQCYFTSAATASRNSRGTLRVKSQTLSVCVYIYICVCVYMCVYVHIHMQHLAPVTTFPTYTNEHCALISLHAYI